MAIDPKEVVRRVPEEVYGRGRLGLIDELFDESFVGHGAFMGEMDRRGLTHTVQMFRKAFPDLRVEVLDILGEGDRVALLWRWKGTHQGPFFGRSATHKRVTVEGLTLARVRDSKIVEAWVQVDSIGLFQQLGIVPPLERGEGRAAPRPQPRR